MVRTAALVLALGVTSGAFFGCGADDDDSAGTGGGIAGVGGSLPSGTGGVAPAGTGGTTAGTGGVAGSAGSMAGMDFVPGSPTFKAIYQEVFVGTGCSGGPFCHGSGNLTGGLDMSDRAKTYMELVNIDAASKALMPANKPDCVDSKMKRVVPGMPDASLIMDKITKMKPVCGQPMPPTGMIDAAKIEQVRMWIAMGAKDD